MSIRIEPSVCTGCGRCIEVCPGNLIKKDQEGRAVIKRERDCWGCTSCLKECRSGAVRFFLGADIGGRGGVLSVKCRGDARIWTITDAQGVSRQIEVNSRDANKY